MRQRQKKLMLRRLPLNEDPIALLSENVGDLLRNSGHRAPTAQEEIISLTATAWHGSDRRPQEWLRGLGCGAQILLMHVATAPTGMVSALGARPSDGIRAHEGKTPAGLWSSSRVDGHSPEPPASRRC